MVSTDAHLDSYCVVCICVVCISVIVFARNVSDVTLAQGQAAEIPLRLTELDELRTMLHRLALCQT